MKKFSNLVLYLALFIISGPAFSQLKPDNKSLKGSWMGKIPAGGIFLRVIFNIDVTANDSLTATLDSPDQGVKGIKTGVVTFDGKVLDIKAPVILGEYNGTIKSDTLIEGTWKQAGKVFDLNLTKLLHQFSLNRPQEPKAPYPYTSNDVSFRNEKADISLSGTLTIPEGSGPFPAVVLITGSGPQNRNEELLGHKPFLVIADWLSRNGIVVLRYDDRGIGKSQGIFSAATTADFATDAAAAVSFLKTCSSVNPARIGLAGHSEGGLIAPIVAAGNKDIAFIITLAGPGVIGEKILNRQNFDISKAAGANEKDIKKGISANTEMFSIVKKEKDNSTATEKMIAAYSKLIDKEKLSSEDKSKALNQLKSQTATLTSPWFRYFLTLDPAPYWKKVSCPVLILNGEKDLQVAADVNPPAIVKALSSGGNKSYTVKILPGLNHLFQHSSSGAPSEYGNIEETFSPEVLRLMSDWIRAL